MKKLMILGSGGMLGHAVNLYFRKFPELFTVVDIARKPHTVGPSVLLDATDFDGITKLYLSELPDIIINCIGVLNTDAEKNPYNAILTNSYVPHFLGKLTSGSKCRIIQISTDCVFSGDRGNYLEKDFMDGNSYYARTKALGEIYNEKDLTIRTSIVGPELAKQGIGLFRWFAGSVGKIKGYKHVYWTGITTVELCKAIYHCIDQEISGLYHMVNNKKISKYELLTIFLNTFPASKVTEIESEMEKSNDKSLINSRNDLIYNVPDYDIMIAEMKSWISEHKEIYPHYIDMI